MNGASHSLCLHHNTHFGMQNSFSCILQRVSEAESGCHSADFMRWIRSRSQICNHKHTTDTFRFANLVLHLCPHDEYICILSYLTDYQCDTRPRLCLQHTINSDLYPPTFDHLRPQWGRGNLNLSPTSTVVYTLSMMWWILRDGSTLPNPSAHLPPLRQRAFSSIEILW